MLVLASLMTIVGSVSAASMFAGVEDILAEVVLIIPSIVDLVVAAIPIILILAIVGFIVTLFAVILGKIKFR